jgi:hypothetical protein
MELFALLFHPLLLGLASALHPPSSVFLPSTSSPACGILFIDAFSPLHSGYMQEEALSSYGAGVVDALSPYVARGLSAEDPSFDHSSLVPPLDAPSLAAWLSALPFPISAVHCESDAGLPFAQSLAAAISKLPEGSLLRSSPPAKHLCDKFLQNEALRAAGVPCVRQAVISTEPELLASFASYEPPVILKPRVGVASENVHLCATAASLASAFSNVRSSNKWGEYREEAGEALLQEFLPGAEFAVDCVSRDGQHKAAAVFVYDKTEAGCGPFAYRGTRLVAGDGGGVAADVVDYLSRCLTALDVRWGLTHSEVKLSASGSPLLVEVNRRQHNAATAPLTGACLGYNALDMCLSAYLDPAGEGAWEEAPAAPWAGGGAPLPGSRGGMIVHLQCLAEGTVAAVNWEGDIRALGSFAEMELYEAFGVGCEVERTRTIRSDCGWVALVNEDEGALTEDYERIVEWMDTMFEVE